MAKFNYFILTLIISIARVLSFSSPIHFGIVRLSSGSKLSPISNLNNDVFNNDETPLLQKSTHLYLNPNDDQSNASSGDATLSLLSEADQTVVGVTGLIMSVVMLYSEYVLKMTGCGLPAGPFGLVGAVEGLSYLGVTGLVAFSLYTKVKTGSGLPAGPYGLLGAAEGVSFLAVLAGLVVLVLQVTNFGYIPNAVPMEGGMCQ